MAHQVGGVRADPWRTRREFLYQHHLWRPSCRRRRSFFNNVDVFLLRVQGRALLYQRQAALILCQMKRWKHLHGIYVVVQAIVPSVGASYLQWIRYVVKSNYKLGEDQ